MWIDNNHHETELLNALNIYCHVDILHRHQRLFSHRTFSVHFVNVNYEHRTPVSGLRCSICCSINLHDALALFSGITHFNHHEDCHVSLVGLVSLIDLLAVKTYNIFACFVIRLSACDCSSSFVLQDTASNN